METYVGPLLKVTISGAKQIVRKQINDVVPIQHT